MPVTSDAVLNALKAVQDPDLHRDIVSLGFVKDLVIRGGDVSFKVELTTPACPVKDLLKRQSEEVVARLPGVSGVHVEMTAMVRGPGGAGGAGGLGGAAALPGVKNVIAVGAGKGGVGKSTIAVNLAIGLAQSGARVGLLDADVYGPSIPTMLASHDRPKVVGENKVEPNFAHGVRMMSIGLVLDPSKPMVVRGPIVHGVIRQFLTDVVWGDLDYLIVDLPPGTGDVALTLAQTVPVTGAVVVSTPQDVSLIDVQKAVGMFESVKIPVLGLVENMSWYLCPSCGHRDEIFGHKGAEAWATERRIPFLGAVPLHASVREGGDEGVPALADPSASAPVKDALKHIAQELARQVSIRVEGVKARAGGPPLIQIQGLK
jgi:ATP-binding protein involved in chromosome partitioning